LAGAFSISKLGLTDLMQTDPLALLSELGEMTTVLPGGVSLLWDIEETQQRNNTTLLASLEGMLLHLQGVNLHTKKPLFSKPLKYLPNLWYHSTDISDDGVATLWCKGFLGWVPQSDSGWSVPGIGHISDGQNEGDAEVLWGEVTIPATAISHLDIEGLKLAVEDTQAGIERAMSHRINANAWPQLFPFQRRNARWRLTLTGGREFQLSGQSWDRLATDTLSLQTTLAESLKCKIHLGINSNAIIAGLLAEQAMKFGFPWRNSLRSPPAPVSYTLGIAADPRENSPLESRAFLPKSVASILSDPPVALLRVPTVPPIEESRAFIKNLETSPAIRWLPPEIPSPGPFHPDIPWDPAVVFPAIRGSKNARQPSLFD
jgi:hypothetical protein